MTASSDLPHIRIDPPPHFGIASDLDLLALPPTEVIEPGCVLRINLVDVIYITPIALVGLLALIDRFRREAAGRTVEILLPEHPELLAYLRKVRFLDALETFTTVGGSGREILASGDSEVELILPIQTIDSEFRVEQLSQEIISKFGSEFTDLSVLSVTCHNLFAELASNAVLHSECDRVWVLAQNYPKHGQVVIAIADSGIGIPATLRQNANLEGRFVTDAEAVVLAFEDGVSRTGDPHRGYGLGEVRSDLASPERGLLLRSGCGVVAVSSDGGIYGSECNDTVGTLARVVIPTR